MKKTKHFLKPAISLLILCIFTLHAQAQEVLPRIVKEIEPSTVVILAYDQEDSVIGQGSGFFISQNGDIITNRHVLVGASRAEVKTSNGKVYPFTLIVAEDKEADIIRASVNILAESVRPLLLSNSIPLVGEQIAVIGSPLGLERTVSDGIVSAVREIPEFGKIIQITAPLSPGSSGSPVVNMKGEVIGVATFQIIEGQNLNFAVPSEYISKLKVEKSKTLEEWETGKAEEGLASAEELYCSGLIFLWADDYEKALPYFEKAAKKNPNYAEAYFQIGYCNSKFGRYKEAVEAYTQAIRVKPNAENAYLNLGVTYYDLGLYTEAIEAYKQAIRIQPDFAEAHNNIGNVYEKFGRYTEAIEAYKQSIRIQPDDAAAHYNLGVSYGKLGRHTEAIEAYKQSIRIQPDLAEAHYNLGAAYYNLCRYTEAIEAYKQSIHIQPDFAKAHNNIGNVCEKFGRYTEAIEAYKQAIRIQPDFAEAHYNLGVAYGNLGRYTEEIEAYKLAIRIEPDFAKAHFNMGVAYVNLGNYTEAIEAIKQAIRIKPDDAEAHYGLGLTYLIVGDRSFALDQYKILKNLDSDLANELFNSIYK